MVICVVSIGPIQLGFTTILKKGFPLLRLIEASAQSFHDPLRSQRDVEGLNKFCC